MDAQGIADDRAGLGWWRDPRHPTGRQPAVTVTAPPVAACPCCGARFRVTAGRAREAVERGEEPIGRRCSCAHAWWLERFTLEELLEIARMIWPELALTGAGSSPGHLTEPDEACVVELAVPVQDRVLVDGKV